MGFTSQLVDIEEARKNRERLETLRKPQQAITQLISTPSPITTLPAKHKPSYSRSEKGYKRGYYTKTKDNMESVCNLYRQGLGIRLVAKELKLSRNTIRKIVNEHPSILEEAKEQREICLMKRTTDAKGNIIVALIGLASSGKRQGYSWDTILNRAKIILQNYLDKYPVKTILTLMGTESFSVDDIIKRVYEIILRQSMRLDDRFEEVNKDTFRLKEISH